MKKPLFSAIYILTLLTAGLTIHQAFAQTHRSPSVEPITEISIEENRPVIKEGQTEQGFDFADRTVATTATAAPTPAATEAPVAKRIPANITTKSSEQSTPYSYIGPMIFLFALPIALWIVISKKMKTTEVAEKIDYYPKTFQFKPYKTDYQEQDVDDEEHNLPKASQFLVIKSFPLSIASIEKNLAHQTILNNEFFDLIVV